MQGAALCSRALAGPDVVGPRFAGVLFESLRARPALKRWWCGVCTLFSIELLKYMSEGGREGGKGVCVVIDGSRWFTFSQYEFESSR